MPELWDRILDALLKRLETVNDWHEEGAGLYLVEYPGNPQLLLQLSRQTWQPEEGTQWTVVHLYIHEKNGSRIADLTASVDASPEQLDARTGLGGPYASEEQAAKCLKLWGRVSLATPGLRDLMLEKAATILEGLP